MIRAENFRNSFKVRRLLNVRQYLVKVLSQPLISFSLNSPKKHPVSFLLAFFSRVKLHRLLNYRKIERELVPYHGTSPNFLHCNSSILALVYSRGFSLLNREAVLFKTKNVYRFSCNDFIQFDKQKSRFILLFNL